MIISDVFLSAAWNRVLSERMFDMKRYKHKNKVVFWLRMLLIASFLAAVPVSPVHALGVDTKPFNPDYEEDCGTLTETVGDAVEDKWWEKPLDSVLDASVNVGNSVFDNVKDGAISVLAVGLGLWLAIFTMGVVGKMTESDPLENFTKIGSIMMKGVFAIALLKNKDFFFDYFIGTPVQLAAGFVNADEVVTYTDHPDNLWQEVATLFEKTRDEYKTQERTLQSFTASGGLQSAADALKAIANSIHYSIALVSAKADYLTCLAEIHEISIGFSFLFTDPKVWMSGCVMKIGAFFFMVAFPFFLIDAAFRLGVVAALSPLFIISWVFPATKDFAGKGWAALLNIAFTFIMIKISALIGTKLLTSGSGLDEMGDDKDSYEKFVCIYRWFNWADSDPCKKYEPLPGTNSMFTYIVCVIYGLLLMKNGNELAGHFSGAKFEDKTAFAAAKGAVGFTKRAVSDGIKAGGYVKDKVQTHRARSAARNYERHQQKRQAAMNGGPAYNPTAKEKKQLEKDVKLLQSRRVGALNKDGTENGKVLGDLLENGKARKAMRFIDKALGGTGESFKNYGDTYTERSKEQIQSLKTVGRNSHKSSAAQAQADTAAKNMAQRQYDNTPQGQTQKTYDGMLTENLQKSADYKKKCASDINFADSAEGKKMSQELAKERLTLDGIRKEYGCDDKILDPNFGKENNPSVDFGNLSSFK